MSPINQSTSTSAVIIILFNVLMLFNLIAAHIISPNADSIGNSNTICGLYLLARPEENVVIDFLHFNVSCDKHGLLSVMDGWELNGQFFPGPEDHPLPRQVRYHEFCGGAKPRKTFPMSQNAGLIEFRIPIAGQGFMVRVRFVPNPKPCNVIMVEVNTMYTIRNFGRRTNCTVSLLYEGSFQILSMIVGHSHRPIGNLLSSRNFLVETSLLKKCQKRGRDDYVELLGGYGLDPNQMQLAEDMCGVRTASSYKRKFTVHCPNTAVRLVSSGRYDNSVEFAFNFLDAQQLSNDSVLVCQQPN
ncbi:hypothetical protein TYRP_019078 [Tyrophagus putrescentiae]|nr:hypothetical protein TYRP_019078 [Tyrophagus putrescentiae]